MTDRRDSSRRPDEPGERVSAEAIDTGEPVEILRAVAVTPRPGFMGRIRGSIQRRTLGSQLADLSWKALTEVIFEYLSLVFGLFSTTGRTQRGSE